MTVTTRVMPALIFQVNWKKKKCLRSVLIAMVSPNNFSCFLHKITHLASKTCIFKGLKSNF